MGLARKSLLLLGGVAICFVASIAGSDSAVADDSVKAAAVSVAVRARLPMVSNDSLVENPSTAKIDASGQAVATTGPSGVASLSDSTREYQITVESDAGPITGIRVGVIVQDSRTLVVANDPSGRYLPAFAAVKTDQNLTAATESIAQFIKVGFKLISVLEKAKTGLEAFKAVRDLGSSSISMSLSDIQPFSTAIPFVGGTAITKCLTPAQLVAATDAAFFAGGIAAGFAITIVTGGTTTPLIPILASIGAGLGGDIANYLVDKDILTSTGNYTVTVGLLSFGLVALNIPFIQIVKDNCGKPLPPSGVGMTCPASVVVGSQIQCSAFSDSSAAYSWSSSGNTAPSAGVGSSFFTTPAAVGTVTIVMRACGSGGCAPDVSRDVYVASALTPAPTPTPTPSCAPWQAGTVPGDVIANVADPSLVSRLHVAGVQSVSHITLTFYQVHFDPCVGSDAALARVQATGVAQYVELAVIYRCQAIGC